MKRHDALRATWAPGQIWETRNDEQAHDPNAWVPVGDGGRAQPLWDEHQEYRLRPAEISLGSADAEFLEQHRIDDLMGVVVEVLPGRAGPPASAQRPVHGGYPTTAPKGNDDTRDDDLYESARQKIQAGAGMSLTKQEANAYFAAGLFNPINQVYFRAGLIACREYMARFVEAQSPETAASIRANWWPQLGPDFGPPRRMDWNELVASGDELPVRMREDISPTLEALPIALQFLQTPEPAPIVCSRTAGVGEGS